MPRKQSRVDAARCAVVAESCLNFSLRRAARAVGAIYDDALRPTGLRGTQFNLLVALALLGTATVTRVAEVLAVDRTTLTRGLAPLERDRLVESVPGDDGRERLLRLTDAGCQRVDEATVLWERAQKRVLEVLGGKRLRTLHAGLAEASAMLRS